MKRYHSSIIGAFVLGAIFLAGLGIISFGGGGWWVEREYFAVYFKESVHGLEQGSAVKMKGVRIGRVAAINIAYQPEGGAIAQVICELDESRVVDSEGMEINLLVPANLQELVDNGLRARLSLTGITGMLYVDLDFFNRQGLVPVIGEHSEYVVVPTVSSALSGIGDNLAKLAQDLGEVDFAGIGESITRFMDTANTALEGARLEELVSQLQETVTSMNEILNSKELSGALQKAGQSFEDVSRLAETLEAQVEPLAENVMLTTDELRKTLDEVARTFTSLHDVVGPRLGLGPRFSETLESLDEAARSVQRLADFLERNPQAILRGRGDEL